MLSEEVLLGFDGRDGRMEMDSGVWPRERVLLYLLRWDVVRPLSTDRLVWPGLARPEGVERTPAGLWRRLDAVLERVRGSALIPVALTLVRGGMSDEKMTESDPYLVQTDPADLNEEWELLGYDVSDLGLLSGLSNCGYDASTRRELRERWGRTLNRYHLFADCREAHVFREATDARVPEHAPFFVFGLYQRGST